MAIIKNPITVAGKNRLNELLTKTISNLTDADFQGVTKIENYTFYQCNNLRGTITLPNWITELGDSCFRDSDHITRIELPSGLTTIGAYCFEKCQRLASVDIPDTVTTIKNYAFNNIYSLTYFNTGKGCTSLGIYVCQYCTSLTFAIVGDNVLHNSSYYGQFASASHLKKLVVGAGLSTIPNYFASYDNELISIILRRRANGSDVSVPALSNTTYLVNNQNAVLYTWIDSIPYYAAATNWVSFVGKYAPLVDTASDLSNIDTTTYTKACVVGADESYKEYTYDGSTWNEVV